LGQSITHKRQVQRAKELQATLSTLQQLLLQGGIKSYVYDPVIKGFVIDGFPIVEERVTEWLRNFPKFRSAHV